MRAGAARLRVEAGRVGVLHLRSGVDAVRRAGRDHRRGLVIPVRIPAQAARPGVMLPLRRLARGLALASSSRPRALPSPVIPPSPAAPLGGITRPVPKNFVPLPTLPTPRENREAVVVLSLDLDVEGHVTRGSVAESAGAGFDEAALLAGKKLEFSPARKADGTPFAVRIKFTYTFVPRAGARRRGRPREEGAGRALGRGAGQGQRRRHRGRGGRPHAGGKRSRGASSAVEASTDAAGAFSFKDLAPGKYRVAVRAQGVPGVRRRGDVRRGRGVRGEVPARPEHRREEVTVEGERPPREVAKGTIDAEEINRIPGTNGDALRRSRTCPASRGRRRSSGSSSCAGRRPRTPRPSSTDGNPDHLPLRRPLGGRAYRGARQDRLLPRQLQHAVRPRHGRRRRRRHARPEAGRNPRLRAGRPHRRPR